MPSYSCTEEMASASAAKEEMASATARKYAVYALLYHCKQDVPSDRDASDLLHCEKHLASAPETLVYVSSASSFLMFAKKYKTTELVKART